MIDAMISVRAASTRLPNKCFLDIAGRSVIKHVIERCTDNGLNPIIATTADDTVIIDLCQRLRLRHYAGSAKDKLDRWNAACSTFNVKSFVTVDCDDPLFDPELSKQQFELIKSGYDVVKPDMRAYLGSNGWAFKAEAIARACLEKKSNDTEMIWNHIPSDLNTTTFDARAQPCELDLRLTLDYIEDYWLILTMVRNLGYNATRPQIIKFFEKHQGLRILNDFRNEEWKLKQAK
jgi:spore coat polysaccharide biosynthesis protein SpsF (cytidylyltransferase family)